VDIGALEARVNELSRQLSEAQRELLEARKTEVRFRYRYAVNGRALEGEYLRVVLPRGVTLLAAPPGWAVRVTPWSGRVKLGRVVTRNDPHVHVFSCAAPMSWVRDRMPSAQSGDRADGPAEGADPSMALVRLPAAGGALPDPS
jgi:hypothetical protein